MALELSTMNALSALSKLGIEPSDLEPCGATPVLTSKGFQFKTPTGTLSVPMTLTQLVALNNGKMPSGEKAQIAMQVKALLKTAPQADPVIASPQPVLAAPDLLAALPPLAPGPVVTAHKADDIPWDPLTPALANKMPAVPLLSANRLYQPVKSTSASARYALVAARPDLKVGLRIKDTSLSLRVESTQLSAYKYRLETAGWTMSSAHSSIHLSIPDQVMMFKTIGSLLMGLLVSFHTPLPDPDTLKELHYA